MLLLNIDIHVFKLCALSNRAKSLLNSHWEWVCKSHRRAQKVLNKLSTPWRDEFMPVFFPG